MHDATTTIPRFLCEYMPEASLRQVECMEPSKAERSEFTGTVSRAGQGARNQDAGIARLRKLRDYYKQTHQPREVKAIERAIVVLRDCT